LTQIFIISNFSFFAVKYTMITLIRIFYHHFTVILKILNSLQTSYKSFFWYFLTVFCKIALFKVKFLIRDFFKNMRLCQRLFIFVRLHYLIRLHLLLNFVKCRKKGIKALISFSFTTILLVFCWFSPASKTQVH